jgi:hypothetical protein
VSRRPESSRRLTATLCSRSTRIAASTLPRATGSGQTRAGFGERELVADVVALLERGINIVTTCTDLFARGARLSKENRALVSDACAKGNASL